MLNELEKTVLSMLVAGEHPVLALLREQVAVVEVADREFSGCGFFVEFRVPESSPRVAADRLVIGDVYAELVGLEHSVGFLLFVSEGQLDMLECFGVDDDFPGKPELNRAYYVRREETKSTLIETDVRDFDTAFKALPSKPLQRT